MEHFVLQCESGITYRGIRTAKHAGQDIGLGVRLLLVVVVNFIRCFNNIDKKDALCIND